jgi:hypothetical protein
MITVSTPAALTALDAPTGATLNTIDVDLRGQQGAGGSLQALVAATGVAAGSVSFPVNLDVVDPMLGGKTSAINIDARGQANEGGFANLEVLTAAITYAGASAPVAPTLGTAVSGALAARNETFDVTYVDANGNESLPSPTAAEAIAANSVATVTSPGASTGAVKYNVYGVITGGTPTLQNATPIAIGTGWQEPNTGLTTTGRVAPTNSTLVSGAATATVSQGGAFATGVATTLTISQ